MRISDWSSDVCSSDLPEIRGDILVGRVDHLAGIITRGGEIDVGEIFPDRDQPGLPRQSRLIIDGVALGVPFTQFVRRPGMRHLVAEDRLHLLRGGGRSEEHTSELQSLMRISYAVSCLINKNTHI